jgi:hypothetical protein
MARRAILFWRLGEETRRVLPIARATPPPMYQSTRAISIQAPPEAVGDTVRLAPTGFLGGAVDRSSQLRVAAIDPGRLLVLRGWGTFVLDSLPRGGTRLLVREQTALPASRWGTALLKLLWEPPHFIMERQMLRGIRDRAEGRAAPGWFSWLATGGFAAMALTIIGVLSRRSRWPWLLCPLATLVVVMTAAFKHPEPAASRP